MAVNWGLAQQPNAFERAFSQGREAAMQQRAMQREEDSRNALASYAMKPNEASFNALAQHAPEYAMQVQGQRQQAAQQGVSDRRDQLPVLGRLLAQATPETWTQTIATAQQYGFDVTDVPQQFDPVWRENTVALVTAMQNPETQQQLPGIARELQAAGIDVETPEGQRVLRQVIEGRYGSEYTDPQGNVRRQRLFDLPAVGGQAQAPQMGGVPSGSPLSQPAPQQAQGPAVGAVEEGYRFRGGNPADPNSWEPVSQQMNAPAAPQGQPETLTRQEVQSLVQQYGQETISRLMQAGRIVVGN